MSRVVLLTDDLVREALEPAPGLVAPDRVLDGIATGIRETPQRRTMVDRLGVAAPAFPALGLGADRRLGWMLAAAILGAMILGAAAVGAWLLRDTSDIELVPTGVEVLAPGTGFDDVVVDGRGMGWAVGPGRVTKFDPVTGERRVWTVADDEAFAEASILAGARAGGVWMAAGPMLVRFDGTAFRDPLALPTDELTAVAEAADGTLWALSGEERIWRWTGTSWEQFPGVDGCSSLVVLGSDDVWAGCLTSEQEQPVVEHLVDGRWTTYGADDLPILSDPATFVLAGGPDGGLWLAAGDAIVQWNDGAWDEIEGPGFRVTELVALPNGDLLAASLWDEATLARWDSSAWWPIATPDGGMWLTAITAAGTDLLAATDAGLFRLGGSSWETVSRDPLDGPSLSGFPTGRLVALSAEEAWVMDDRGVWRYRGDQWIGPDRPSDLEPAARFWGLAISPNDGELAIATDGGVAVRRDGIWSWAWRGEARAVGYAPDGSIWTAAADRRLVHISEAGDGMVAETVFCPAGGLLLAVSADGAAFTGGIGYNGTPGLARADATGCQSVAGYGGIGTEVAVLEPDPTGGVVALILQGTNPPPWTASIIRSAGSTWSTLWSDEPTSYGYAGGMTVDEQGRVWLGVLPDGRGIQRYEAGTWRVVSDADTGTDLSVAPDGTLWFTGSSGIERISADQLR